MRRVTVSMPDEVFARVQDSVARGAAPSVSAFVARAADEHTRERDLKEVLDELDAVHGPPDAEARAWARRVVDR